MSSPRWLFALVLTLTLLRWSPAAEPVDAFGDPLPQGATGRLGTVRLRHGGSLNMIAFSPDGKLLATAGTDNSLRLWDLATGRLVRNLGKDPALPMPPARGFAVVAFSADSKRLAAATTDGTVTVYTVATGKCDWELNAKPRFHDLVFAPDGQSLAGARGDFKIFLWDATSGKLKQQINGQALRLAFSPDSKSLAGSLGTHFVYVWDIESGKQILHLRDPLGPFTVPAFSPDGKTLLAAGVVEANKIRVYVWDRAGKQQQAFEAPATPFVPAFSGDGKRVATALFEPKAQLSVFDVATGKRVRDIEMGPGQPSCLGLSPDGNTLAVGNPNAVLLWDIATGKERLRFPAHAAVVRAVAVAPDGRSLVTATDEESVRRWDLTAAGRDSTRLDLLGRLLGLSADGAVAATSDANGIVHVWDTVAARERTSFSVQDTAPGYGAVSGDGQQILVPLRDGSLVIWNSRGEKKRTLQVKDSGVRGLTDRLVFSPDGRLLAGVSGDGSARIWDVVNGREMHKLAEPGRGLSQMSFSAGGHLLVAGTYEGVVRVYESLTGQKVWEFGEAGQPGMVVKSVRLSPDDRLLLLGGYGLIRVWDLAAGKEQSTLVGHLGHVLSLAFDPQGRTLASGSEDTSVLLWDLSSLPAQAAEELSARDLDTLWNDLKADAARAIPAVYRLADGAKQAIPFLAERLKPGPPPDEKQLARLIADLASDDGQTVRRANEELKQLEEHAEPALRAALEKTKDADVRLRITVLLARLRDREVTPERLRLLRAVQALEMAGTPEARTVLTTLTTGADLAREARLALERLSRRPGLK